MRMTTPLLGSLISESSSWTASGCLRLRLLGRRACRLDSHTTPLSIEEDVALPTDPRCRSLGPSRPRRIEKQAN